MRYFVSAFILLYCRSSNIGGTGFLATIVVGCGLTVTEAYTFYTSRTYFDFRVRHMLWPGI